MTLAQGVKACFALICGLGYSIYPKSKSSIDKGPAWRLAIVLWFMSRIPSFRTLLATGIHECRAMIDLMLAAAPRSKTSVAVEKIEAMKP